jgi:hypothetical protein
MSQNPNPPHRPSGAGPRRKLCAEDKEPYYRPSIYDPFAEWASCGRRVGRRPDLDRYDNAGSAKTAAYHACRLWQGSSW